MKRKCMAIARKVMVWTLAASMLVATPLTASAKELNEVYKIEDNAGNLVPSDSINTRTGTVTSTNSRTSVLDNEGKIEGIALDETDINLALNGSSKEKDKQDLTVTILTSGEITAEEMDKLQRSLTWRSSDTAVVALGNLAKENGGNTQKMQVKAKAGGKATVTVSLDNYAENIHFTATANVSVKEYATKLAFSEEYIPVKEGNRYGYVKHSVDLNAALVKTPATANDEVTFEIVGGDKNVAAIDKKGVLSYKKEGTVKIVAIGERVKSETLTIKIEAGKPANKVEIWLDEDVFGKQTKKAAAQKPDVSKTDKGNRTIEVVARLEVGKTKAEKHWAGYNTEGSYDATKRSGECTDAVKWSSNKPAIVKVQANGDKATLVPAGVGSAVITAQASTGKKATLSVKVSATMTSIKITSVKQDVWSGQSIKLEADRYFGTGEEYKNFSGSDAVTWYLENNAADKKIAQIKKDVFTAKTAVGTNPVVKVKVRSAKKYGTPKNYIDSTDVLELTLKQADVRTIEVYDGSTVRAKAGFTGAANKLANAKDGTVVINAGNGKTFLVVAKDKDGNTTLPNSTTPLATTLNISSNKEKTAIASRNADGNAVVNAPADAVKGTANIVVSGTKCTNEARGKYAAIKATFKANVKIPAKSIQLAYKQKVVKATTVTKGGATKTKKQNVSVVSTLPKGTTTAAKDIKWTAKLFAADGTVKIASFTIKNGKNGVVTLEEDTYAAGDTLVVTASIKEKQNANDKVTTGAISTIRIPVVTPTRKAEIRDGSKSDTPLFKNSKNKSNQADLSVSGTGEIKTTELTLVTKVDVNAKGEANFVDAGDVGQGENKYVAAGTTYTVNKKGIVSIVDGKVTGIKAGTVKITATTTDGKKATLTVKVVD